MIKAGADTNKYCVLARGTLMSGGKFEYRGYAVVERATDQTIKQFDTLEEATKFAKSLRTGQGFDGWTPSFMLKNYFDVSEKTRQF